MSFYRPKHCLLCQSNDITKALSLGTSAIGNDFFKEKVDQQKYSLDLILCRACGNVQIEDIVDPNLLFGSYTYSTSSSLGLVKHFQDAATEIQSRYSKSPQGSLVIDIGSNDGSLLKAFQSNGLKVLGVDPAKSIAENATINGIPTIGEFFTSSLAHDILSKYGHADIVTANNVFAHSDQLPDMADGIRILLSENGIFSFEVSYVLDIVHRMLFDTVYHEHLFYHSVKSLNSFFSQHDLQLIDIQRINTKGGSLRGTVQLKNGPRPVEASVSRLLELESLLKLNSLETFTSYQNRISAARSVFIDTLQILKKAGKSIAGYGASPTVTTLINTFDCASYIDCLYDDNPVKQFTYSPGDHIPVYPSENLYSTPNDFVTIFAWNYWLPISKRHAEYLNRGGRFLLPLPTFSTL